jgi:hypothetical protein
MLTVVEVVGWQPPNVNIAITIGRFLNPQASTYAAFNVMSMIPPEGVRRAPEIRRNTPNPCWWNERL